MLLLIWEQMRLGLRALFWFRPRGPWGPNCFSDALICWLARRIF